MKILIIGDSGSNKRRLLGKYLRDDDLTDTTTLGLDYKLKDIVHRGKAIKLQLWDTAGQERFRSVTASYYRGAHGALLVFTLSRETSFVGLNYWLEEIKNNAPQRFQVMLVATDTKSESASVNLEIARQFALGKQLDLIECDVDEESQVDSTFNTLVDKIMRNWETGMAESIHLTDLGPLSQERNCPC